MVCQFRVTIRVDFFREKLNSIEQVEICKRASRFFQINIDPKLDSNFLYKKPTRTLVNFNQFKFLSEKNILARLQISTCSIEFNFSLKKSTLIATLNWQTNELFSLNSILFYEKSTRTVVIFNRINLISFFDIQNIYLHVCSFTISFNCLKFTRVRVNFFQKKIE